MTDRTFAALVSGAAKGIGAAIATALSYKGHPTILLDVDEQVHELARVLNAAGGDVIGLTTDVSDEKAVAQISQQAPRHWRELGILVNNAGISPKRNGVKPLVEDTPVEEWRRVMEVNLTAPFLLSKACIPIMRSNGWGRIIMLTSQAAYVPSGITGAYYGASKAGLLGFSRTLALEVAEHGITVNCIAPGRIWSDMVAAAKPEHNQAFLDRIPLKRFGQPEDVAKAALFLVSEDAAYMTGTTTHVGGGSYMP